MAPPTDLRQIGLEGFALIDKHFGPQYKRPNVGRQELVIMNSKEAANHYGGISIVTYPKPKPLINRWVKANT